MDAGTSISQDEIEKKYFINDDVIILLKKEERVVIILEKIQDIELLTYIRAIKTEGLCIIAVSPAVSWELEKRSIAHTLLN
jgi:hypothetical protein